MQPAAGAAAGGQAVPGLGGGGGEAPLQAGGRRVQVRGAAVLLQRRAHGRDDRGAQRGRGPGRQRSTSGLCRYFGAFTVEHST